MKKSIGESPANTVPIRELTQQALDAGVNSVIITGRVPVSPEAKAESGPVACGVLTQEMINNLNWNVLAKQAGAAKNKT